jgi:opacity protein-like surface antigen
MRYILCVISLIVLLPLHTPAQDKKSLLIFGGTAVPVNPDAFYSDYDKGFNIGAGIEIPFKKSLHISGEASYSKFTAQEVSATYSGSISTISVMVNLKATTENSKVPLSFFVKGGAGFHSTSHTDASAPYKELFESQANLALNFAGGIEYKLSSKNGIFVEVAYNYFFAKEKNIAIVPIRIGLKFSN